MHIFPTSNFDHSAITPVFLGALVSWLLTETLGWVFAGLVVSGYLATLLVLEPRSAAIDIVEAVLTYGIARLLGEHLSRTGLTSRVFGRERFLLIVLVSILVRLGLEGAVFAYLLPRATWAYSIGLVVVPLAANTCWKTGLLRGVIRTGVPTAIVYVLLRYVLLPHTNLSLAWFQLANEDVAASFLASPRAYVVLVTGAVLAAAANLRYGWDYHGIMLPALLALAVDSPGVLATTLIEVLVLLWIVRGLLRWTRVGRWNIEGPRRPMLFFTTDYALRFGAAALLGSNLPSGGFVQASGFGYLVPTLLAVKISEKDLASIVLLPTAAVAVVAFGLGNLLGFAAERFDPSEATTNGDTKEAAPALAPAAPTQAALWLSALARPDTEQASPVSERGAGWLAQLAVGLLDGDHARVPPDVTLQRLEGGVLLLRERFQDEHSSFGMPAILLAAKPAQRRVVALIEQPLGTPESAALAGHLLSSGLVDALVIAGADSGAERAWSGETSARATANALAKVRGGASFDSQGFVVTLKRSATQELRVAASAGARNEPRVAAVAAALGSQLVDLSSEHYASSELERDVVIDVPPGYAGTWLDTAVRPVALSSGSARAMVLDGTPKAAQQPPLEDSLALSRLVLTPLLSTTTPASALAVIRESANALGYELLGPTHTSDGADAVVLRPRADSAPAPALGAGASKTAPLALVARLQKRSGLVVEVPMGTHDALRGLGIRLADRLDADAVLVGLDAEYGALRNAPFAAAHAAALSAARDHGVVVLRVAAIDTKTAMLAELARWGGDGADSLALRCTGALAQLGIATRAGALDPVTREQAGRSVFGRTPLVTVTVDPDFLQRPALTRAEPMLEAFAEFPVVDAECSAVAATLARDLPAQKSPATAGLLQAAKKAAVERSVVARRALEDALATTSSKAAVVRASSGVFLVVVGKRAHGLVAAAFPLALALGAETAPSLQAATLAGCASALDHGGSCIVESGP